MIPASWITPEGLAVRLRAQQTERSGIVRPTANSRARLRHLFGGAVLWGVPLAVTAER